MKELYTEIKIEASATDVWKAVTDFDGYQRWNPFIVTAHGKPEPGEIIQILINPPGKKPIPYKVKILNVDREKELRWRGKMFIRGILDGEHTFELQEVRSDHTKLIQREVFSGLLLPLVWSQFLNTSFRSGFEESNRQLKDYVEGIAKGTK